MLSNIKPGLVSVTFRKLAPEAIVDLVARAGLAAIEWGGDIHVPHGDLAAARSISRMTTDAGLTVASYGSYYRLGESTPEFETVLETALELGAPMIRVWAGTKGSTEADSDYRRLIVGESIRIAELAKAAGLAISYEYHGGTLTDTADSTLALLKSVSHPAVRTYWQPPVGMEKEACLHTLTAVLPWLTNMHVFHWHPTPADRHPLTVGSEAWPDYLELASSTKRPHFALIEFVKNDDPDTFLQDAATLKHWLNL